MLYYNGMFYLLKRLFYFNLSIKGLGNILCVLGMNHVAVLEKVTSLIKGIKDISKVGE